MCPSSGRGFVMAEKRMFAKTIIDSDAFLDMPLSSQALYFHLSMRADDEGFINNPKKIQRMIGASDDDLRVLSGKKFIIPFESGIVVIKHWRIHNYIRSDRLNGTKYTSERAQLIVNENGAYSLKAGRCLADVGQMTGRCQPQISIDKISIDKTYAQNASESDCVNDGEDAQNEDCANEVVTVKRKKEYAKSFEEVWAYYPRHRDKGKAYAAYQARLKDGWSEEELLGAVKEYAKECRKNHTEDKYIKLASTFFSVNTPFTDYIKKKEPVANSDDPIEFMRAYLEGNT